MNMDEQALDQHEKKRKRSITGCRKLAPAKMTRMTDGLPQLTSRAPSFLKNRERKRKSETTTAGETPRPERLQHRQAPIGSPPSDSAGDPTIVKCFSSRRYGTRLTAAAKQHFESSKRHTALKRNLNSISQVHIRPPAPVSAPALGLAQSQTQEGKRRAPNRPEPNCSFISADGRRQRSTPNLTFIDANRKDQDSAALAVAPSVTVKRDVVPSSGDGGCLGDHRRSKSRLSLGRHRRDDDRASRGRGKLDSVTLGYPWGASFQQQQGMIHGHTRAFPTTRGDNKANAGAGSVPLRSSIYGSGLAQSDAGPSPLLNGGNTPPKTTTIPCPQPPLLPPPFVGLKNLGNTCYVNAVVQALHACLRAVAKLREATAGRDNAPVGREAESSSSPPSAYRVCNVEGQSERLARTDELFAVPSSAYATNEAEESLVAEVSSPENSSRYDRKPVLDALSTLLAQMEESNVALALTVSRSYHSEGDRSRVRPSSARARYATKNPETGVMTCDSKVSGCASGMGGKTVEPAELDPLYACETPACSKPKTLGSSELCGEALTPTTVVELIRAGGLEEKMGAFAELAGGLGGGTALPGFGGGQQCVSELLSKVLDADDVSGKGHVAGYDSGLAADFRGALCIRMMCMECERHSVNHEPFKELMLPPLVQNEETAEDEGDGQGCSSALPELRTIQDLLETILRSESLGGTNKVWCEACRQWTEAERRPSLHHLPRLLSLHIRPAIVEGFVSSQPSQVIDSPPKGFGAGGFSCGPLKATWQGTGSDGRRALVERVLTVRAGATCQFHEPVTGRTTGDREALSKDTTYHHHSLHMKSRERYSKEGLHEKPFTGMKHDRHNEDVRYDLVGIILHQGQTLDSGHYTFALNATFDSARFTSATATRDGPAVDSVSCSPTARLKSTADSTQCSDKIVTDASVGADDLQGRLSSGLRTERGAGMDKRPSVGEDHSPGFVLFDDERVRWLSSEETDSVLQGVGDSRAEGGLGDAFLVFYARR